MSQIPLPIGNDNLSDQNLYDASPEPPAELGGDECARINRPCDRYRCPQHLWPQTERPGRPHTIGARPPITFIRGQQSCAIDVARANPDGMEVDEIGETLNVCGERVRQIEQRGSLKMIAVKVILDAVEDIREKLPAGAKIVAAFPHNDHHLPGEHFVTIVVQVKPQAVQLVQVRKKKA